MERSIGARLAKRKGGPGKVRPHFLPSPEGSSAWASEWTLSQPREGTNTMSHTRCTEVFFFDELSDKAKERAQDWYRQGIDYEWWDCVYSNIQDAAQCLGITFSTRAVPLMNGKTRQKPEIYFSGFYHQGSGSSFAGTWRAKDTDADKLNAEFPSDHTLHAIAAELAALAHENPDLSASITTHGDN